MIVFPMAGLSSRFFKAGYGVPKYMLNFGGKSVFRHVVEGFNAYMGKEPFLFICRPDYGAPDFVKSELSALGFAEASFEVVVLEKPTRGQAETVALGLQAAEIYIDNVLTIFNVDTVRHNFRRSTFSEASNGYLEVFLGEGDHWSFVLPGSTGNLDKDCIVAVREKERISPLCSNGLYEFKSGSEFLQLYDAQLARGQESWELGELYIAPLYQLGIDKGLSFHYVLCDREKLDFCGVPREYENLLKRFGP